MSGIENLVPIPKTGKQAAKAVKMTAAVMALTDGKIVLDWSPEQVAE